MDYELTTVTLNTCIHEGCTNPVPNNYRTCHLHHKPTPLDQCVFVITREQNEAFRRENEARGYHRDWNHSDLYRQAHGAEMQMAAD